MIMMAGIVMDVSPEEGEAFDFASRELKIVRESRPIRVANQGGQSGGARER